MLNWEARVDLVTSVVCDHWNHMQSCMCQACKFKRGEVDMLWNNTQPGSFRRIPPMLLIDLPRGRIGLHFRHKPYAKPTWNTEICKRMMNGHTRCDIFSLDGRDAKLLATGRGVAKFPDAFCKALGRKHSLTSALRCTDLILGKTIRVFDRDDRQLIWEAYWKSLSPLSPALPPSSTPAIHLVDLDRAADDGFPPASDDSSALDVSGVPMQD